LRPLVEAGTFTVVLRTSADGSWAAIGTIGIAADPSPGRAIPMAETRSDLFDGVIRLTGASVPGGPVAVGSVVTVSLGWYAESRPTVPYTVFIHVVKGSGQPFAQVDAAPDGLGRPTTDWLPGDYVENQYRIALPTTLAAGNYTLIAGLYEAETGRRAQVVGPSTDGQTIQLGTLTIGPP
jgi:hypothetical protein